MQSDSVNTNVQAHYLGNTPTQVEPHRSEIKKLKRTKFQSDPPSY